MPEPHDTTLAYTETYVGETAAPFSQRTSADGRRVTVTGACPRCHGPTSTHFPYGLPGTGNKSPWPFVRRAATPAPAPDVVTTEVHYCECGHPHPQLPAEPVFVGCGASWRVRAAATVPGSTS